MKIQFLLHAETELAEAAAWYDQNANGRGNEFLTEIENAIFEIKEYPELFAIRKHNCRRCLTGRYPYAVIYRIVGEMIIIVSIMHLSRKPEYWKDRLGESVEVTQKWLEPHRE